jgi:hypothetical protein
LDYFHSDEPLMLCSVAAVGHQAPSSRQLSVQFDDVP